MTQLSHKQKTELAQRITDRRTELGISAREVGRRAGVDGGSVARLERGINPNPSMETLTAIASALDLPASDLLTTAGSLPTDELPTFAPYMRAKYPNLPASAIAEIENYAAYLASKHQVSPTGPVGGEDENDY